MHQQVYEFLICIRKNTHVPQHYFDLTKAWDVWPEVMEVMDFHGISSLMKCETPFSPVMLREFYATVYFSCEGPRKMTWMCAGIKCEASLAEFGTLFDIEELPFAPMSYVRIHARNKLMRAETASVTAILLEQGLV